MSSNPRTEVVVVNVNMPFWSMVRFMVKWAIAAIPALIILAVIGALLSALFSGVFTYSQNRKMVDADGAMRPAATRLV
jgi:hypothetical protein